MVYDRADPDRARTTKEKNENRFLVNLGYVLLVAGSLGTPFAAWAARRRPPPEIHVRYREGTGIVLRAVLSTHGANTLADFTDRLAWAAGGHHMVVLTPLRSAVPEHPNVAFGASNATNATLGCSGLARRRGQPMSPVR